VVKGVQFQGLVDAGDPVTQALHYEQHGADELVMLDISATPDQRKTHAELVTALSSVLTIPLTVGGGIKTVDDAVRILHAGADKVSLNTAAVRQPELLSQLAAKFGRQCVVLAVQTGDATWEVVVSCGKERTGLDVVEWARRGTALGAGEILLTSFDRDGTKAGYDCALLRAVTAAVTVPVIASGGASGYTHMLEAFQAGADAVLAASIFHYNETTCDHLKHQLVQHGVRMRLDATSAHAPTSTSTSTSAPAPAGMASSFPRAAQCLVPSIDVMDGRVVQLVGGDPQHLKVDAGSDALKIARQFAIAGEIAVVDLNAALGTGHNTEFIKQLLAVVPCRVGGGIRTIEAAQQWLDAGAHKIVIGTAATPEFLQQLPRGRLIAALDALRGEVVVDGWQTKTGRSVVDQIKLLRPYVSGFLVTFVEREGRMVGIDLDSVRELAAAVHDPSYPEPCGLTVAGGITTIADLAALDALGVEGQVGMAIYTGALDLGRAITAPMVSDRPDGLLPTVVTNEAGATLGLVYSNLESISQAVATQRGVYWSRSRNSLWIKGETSGAVQRLLRVEMDCDRDARKCVVRQEGHGFCHRVGFCQLLWRGSHSRAAGRGHARSPPAQAPCAAGLVHAQAVR
jgi:imidazoleglycerol phosphate synthase cyclase subunit